MRTYLLNNLHKYASKWIVFAIDIVTVAFAFIIAYLIRFNFSLNFDFNKLWVQLPVVIGAIAFSFLITGSYKGVIRHTGFRDVFNNFMAVALYTTIIAALIITNKNVNFAQGLTIPLSILVIHSLISFVSLNASRLLFKMAFKRLTCSLMPRQRVIIYGAGNAGVITYNALVNNMQEKTEVACFIDDNPNKAGKHINGIPVFNREKVTAKYIEANGVKDVIVSIEKISTPQLRKLVDGLIELPVTVKIIPPFEKWINGELNVKQIKQVQIEDLLDRTPILIKNPQLEREFKGETIMVTGAAGSIGSEISRQIAKYSYNNLILIDQAESALYDLQQELKQQGNHHFKAIVADIRDRKRMDFLFQEYKPTMVFHAAAYKHVPLMEETPYEAIKINVIGTKVLADIASAYGVKKFVYVSTDKAVNPTSVMGATKRVAEMYISCLQRESNTRFITTRFGNVLGSNGSVIPLFKKQIEKGGPLTVTHKEVTRYFMTIPEASQLVLEAGAMGKGGEIFIFDMGDSVKIFDLAVNMIKLSGLRYPEDIDIEVTGLRPGEKLYEELLANGENTLPTYHKKIMISRTREMDYVKAKSDIEEICIANLFQNSNIVKKIKELIPEYKSNNSEYEQFDEKKQKIANRRAMVANYFTNHQELL